MKDPLIIIPKPLRNVRILDECATVTEKQWQQLASLPSSETIFLSTNVHSNLILGYIKPERWERVYRRWGFKHRDKCAVCNAPSKDGYLTCLSERCVLRHMCATGYRHREEVTFKINYRNEQK